jgi:hypothetical protein
MATTNKTKADLLMEITHLKASLDSERGWRVKVENDLIDFKQKVRSTAIDVARDNGWCNSGLNETLEELDIEPVATTFHVEVSARLSFDVDLGGDDDVDHDDVRSYLQDKLEEHLSASCQPYNSEWDFTGASGITLTKWEVKK